MAVLTQLTTAVTGNTITAAIWNNEFGQIYSDYNGNITNANISASAAIADSKINFTGSANTYPKANGSGGVTWGALSVNNGFGFLVKGSLTVADGQSMKWPIPTGMTVTNIWHKTTSGTATVRIKKDSTTVATLSVTSTLTNTSSIDSAALTQGQLLTMDITATSSGVDVFILVWVTNP